MSVEEPDIGIKRVEKDVKVLKFEEAIFLVNSRGFLSITFLI
jgi:hypothetical protein